MLTPGLASITFRKLTVPEMIHLVRKSGLKSIEWDSESHLPAGNDDAAQDVRKRTEDAGLDVAAYASHYRAGINEKEQIPFEEILQTAIHLNAPAIRISAGTTSSATTDSSNRKSVVRQIRKIAALAAETNISISLDFRRDTLNDSNEAALQLLDHIDHPNVFSLWQPPLETDLTHAITGLQALLPRLTNVYAFSWKGKSPARQNFDMKEDFWRSCIDLLRHSERDHHILLEFVRDDSPEAFLEDAATLRQWLSEDSE